MTTPFSRIGAKKRAQGLPGDRLPPGQYIPRGWPVLHYGKVPTFVVTCLPVGSTTPQATC